MPAFGKHSRARLLTCDNKLQWLMEEAIKDGPDFSILCGHRGKVEQDAACRAGLSKTPFPTSKHNSMPSKAVDIAPYPIDWEDYGRFRELADHILATAKRLGIAVRWGGTWTSDASDELAKFCDMPHFELEA